MNPVIVAGAILFAFSVGIIVGLFSRYGRGVEHGRRLSEFEHGWVPALSPGAHRMRRIRRRIPWQMVDRNITPTREREELPR